MSQASHSGQSMHKRQIAAAIENAMAMTYSPVMAEMPERLHAVFAPLEQLLSRIEETGEIEAARGNPIFHEAGGWYEVAPAIEGIIQFHRIAEMRTRRKIDLSGLERLAAKLRNGVPLFDTDIERARQCIARCKTHAAPISVAEAADIIDTVRVSMEFDKINGKAA